MDKKSPRDKQSEIMLKSIRDYKDTFETSCGEKVLLDLMKVGKMTGQSFVPGDPHQTSFNEGSRWIVGHILTQLKKDEHDLIKMIEKGEENARSNRDYLAVTDAI